MYRKKRHAHMQYVQKREGCFERINRFFTNILLTILYIMGSVVLLLIVIWIMINWHTITIITGYIVAFLPYALYGLMAITGLIVLLYVIFAFSKILTAITTERTKTRIMKQRAEQERLRTKRISQSLEHERRKEQVALYQQHELQRRRITKYMEVPQDTQDTEQAEARETIPNMPDKPARYRDYASNIRRGELIIGIRRNGPRIGTWKEYKIVLCLGGSSSGKTTTIAQLTLVAASTGGLLVVCDPHGYKEDSLLNKIHPLQHCIYPGSTLAIDHNDIKANLSIVKRELEKRVKGADASTPIYLVVEELNRLQRDKTISAELTSILQSVGQEGRGFNVYCVIGAQQITYLSEIRKAIIAFIIHRVDETEAKLCIPARYAKHASELRTGQTFVKDVDGLTEPLVQPYISARDIARIASTITPPTIKQATQKRHTENIHTRETERIDHNRDTQGLRRYGYKPPHKTRLQPTRQIPPVQEQKPVPSDLKAIWGEWGENTVPLEQDTQKPLVKPEQIVHNIQKDIATQKINKLAQLRKKKKEK